MGTPLYMSPEQCAGGRNLDLRSDIYALGCILYEMVSGAPPFVFDGVGEIIGAHIFHQPRPVGQHDPLVPPWLETVIMKALAKNPAERQQSMEELAAELGGRPSRASRPVGLGDQGAGHGDAAARGVYADGNGRARRRPRRRCRRLRQPAAQGAPRRRRRRRCSRPPSAKATSSSAAPPR